MKRRVTARGLVLRVVAVREADVLVTALCEAEGKVSFGARGARASRRRFAGAFEPFHGVRFVYDDDGKDVAALREAEVVRPRVDVTRDLACVDAAGRLLRWARHVCPPRIPEPAAYERLEGALDRLEEVARAGGSEAAAALQAAGMLAAAGLGLLRDVGYGLETSRCVLCGRARPRGRSASVDAARGGVVCSPCGGRGVAVPGDVLDLAGVADVAPLDALGAASAHLVPLVEGVLALHAGYDGGDRALVPGARDV